MADERHCEDHQSAGRWGQVGSTPPSPWLPAITEVSQITKRRSSALNCSHMRSVGCGYFVSTHFDGGPGNAGMEESTRGTSTSLNLEGAVEQRRYL